MGLCLQSGEISIHALREEGDRVILVSVSWDDLFLSTPSARRATGAIHGRDFNMEFLSTPSARRATWLLPRPRRIPSDFYPRPPRGGRRDKVLHKVIPIHFYPRPPRGGRRLPVRVRGNGQEFLSTPSARRATCSVSGPAKQAKNFYPRPPRGGRQGGAMERRRSVQYFYPRPPRGGRRSTAGHHRNRRYFYPRPPRGGRRLLGLTPDGIFGISIHALREEGDSAQTVLMPRTTRNFYPRPPRGGRPCAAGAVSTTRIFLSTPSARRATMDVWTECYRRDISIHALREEGDSAAGCNR